MTFDGSTLTVSGSANVVNIIGSGSAALSTIFAVDGANGRLFEVSDDLSNSLFSVNTVAGFPVIEAFADNGVYIGKYGQEAIVVSGSGGDLQLSGSIKLPSLPTAADTNVVVFNSSTKKIGYNTALSLQGTSGAQGATGTSIQGSAGTSIQGAVGAQGATGTSIQGAVGAQGTTGTSIQGSVGAQGAAGTSIQGSVGAQGQVGNSIQGAAGAQGIIGTSIQGAVGAQGIIGTSIQGSVGAQGTVGTSIQGSTGTSIQGAAGAQGTTGTSIQGTAGAQGATGTSIQGTAGAQGASGTSIQGTAGAQGTVGASIQGTQGIIGTSIQGSTGTSIQGSSGAQGTQGIIGPVAGSANQVVYKDGSNNPAGSSSLTWDGNTLNVVGLVSATIKSFIIDHPTEPGMQLQYGVLEGPEHSVYVRGKLKNTKQIELPLYWHALVHEESVTVNLTPVGVYRNLWVEEITPAYINIGCDSEELEFFYTVFAERKDIDKLVTEFKTV